FADEEVGDAMVMLKGGTFQAGYEVAKAIAGKHQHAVDSLLVGVNEVSYGRFRKVMEQPIPGRTSSTTYLSEFSQQYGDRSDVADDVPVSGYPADVAIVYCELAGGRLPTSIEWEYAATQGGTTEFPTGDAPAIEEASAWRILSVTEATPDTSAAGIRNLCFSVAEYTDSRVIGYSQLYPEIFKEERSQGLSRETLMKLPEMIEIRGAPQDWVMTGTATTAVISRKRMNAPQPGEDANAGEVFGRIGWRMVRRSAPRTIE
ncbi:MAG: SUMF1/EgtB/PvdO family nonheme iron enzyme, partial [Planctomycetaceae bacterium]|nr:SUMF1/EgtB/PvdO family nonheme iron enzyme [Planctomycetaceae bacterium]